MDAPKQVSKTYETLLGMHEACLKAMVPGKPLKNVYAAAVKYLRDEGKDDLVSNLPKNLGFAVGIDFRDTHLLLNQKNTVSFKAGMVFTLAVSFSGLTLSESARSSLKSNSAVSKRSLTSVYSTCNSPLTHELSICYLFAAPIID